MRGMSTSDHLPTTSDSFDDQPMGGGLIEGGLIDNAVELGLTTEQPKSKFLAQGPALIVIAAVIAAGSLYAMRLAQGDLSSDKATKEVEAKIEQWIARLTAPSGTNPDDPLSQDRLDALFANTDEILAMFNVNHAKRQVPIDYLKMNPFTLRSFSQAGDDDDGAEDRFALQKREQRMRELERELAKMQLQVVVGGRLPVATIDGEFYRVGDTIGSFKIEKISTEKLSVTLGADGQQWDLSMESAR